VRGSGLQVTEAVDLDVCGDVRVDEEVERELRRDDPLGRMISSILDFRPPPMPDFGHSAEGGATFTEGGSI